MHLLSIDDLSDEQIKAILDEGERWFAYNRQPRRNDHRLDGLTIVNAFFENSTRTLLSFEIAANRLGAQVVTIASSETAVSAAPRRFGLVMTLPLCSFSPRRASSPVRAPPSNPARASR